MNSNLQSAGGQHDLFAFGRRVAAADNMEPSWLLVSTLSVESERLAHLAMEALVRIHLPAPKVVCGGCAMRRVDVFFYGLFMDEEILRAKGLRPEGAERAVVEGLSLRIGKRAALVPAPDGRVHGLVFSLTLPELDQLYSEPSVQVYRPQAVLAKLASGGVIAALCYNLPEPPVSDEQNPEYTAKLRSLAQKIGLPAEYVASIQ